MSTESSDTKQDNLISGTEVSKVVRDRVAAEVSAINKAGFSKNAPRLDVIIVGDRPDSATYVRMKVKACVEVGLEQKTHQVPASVTQSELQALVTKLSADPAVHGILVQLPLPNHLRQGPVIECIAREKDVDGLTTANGGLLFRDGIKAPMIPCTPLGCIELLKQSKVQIAGSKAVVLGRSILVGKPIAMLLQSLDATVTMCHSKTRDLEKVVSEADIVIAAIGKANFVKGSWIKKGATVIDVGINDVPDATKKTGYRLVGDVDFASAKDVAGLITPVPGGVGPMTVAMLLENTVSGFYLQQAEELRQCVVANIKSFEDAAAAAKSPEDGSASRHKWANTHAALESVCGKSGLPARLVENFLGLYGLDGSKQEDIQSLIALIKA